VLVARRPESSEYWCYPRLNARKQHNRPPRCLSFAAMAGPEHTLTVVAAGSSRGEPEAFVARCSCGWNGSEFTGQRAREGAAADGDEHRLRAQRSSDGYDPRWPADD
jgi:hypothetical protein